MLLNSESSWPLQVTFPPTPADAEFPDAAPAPHIVAGDGTDITESITGGNVGALMEGLNRIFPSLLGDANQLGDLNRLASEFADRVNEILTSGQLSESDSTPGSPMFEYSSEDTLSAARTLIVNPDISVATLALTSTTPNYDPQGIPGQLLQLSTSDAPPNGLQPEALNYTDFLSGIGRELAVQRNGISTSEAVHTQLLEQSRTIRERASGVTLEEEAVALLQWQRSFESIARLISVLDEMIDTTLNIVS